MLSRQTASARSVGRRASVWSVECGAWCVERGAWSVERDVWGVGCGVWSVECQAPSIVRRIVRGVVWCYVVRVGVSGAKRRTLNCAWCCLVLCGARWCASPCVGCDSFPTFAKAFSRSSTHNSSPCGEVKQGLPVCAEHGIRSSMLTTTKCSLSLSKRRTCEVARIGADGGMVGL